MDNQTKTLWTWGHAHPYLFTFIVFSSSKIVVCGIVATIKLLKSPK